MIDFDSLRDHIYDNYNVPADNTSMAPYMLDAILEYAEELSGSEQAPFLKRMLGNSLEEHEIDQFDF